MTVQQIFDLIDRFAPFETQSEDDNSGFLVGSPSQEVTAALFALDVTEKVIDEAVSLGAQLIVTHHPLMFSPLSALTDADYEGRLIRRLIRENISLIAAHTNLDQAPGGVNDTLAERCGLTTTNEIKEISTVHVPQPDGSNLCVDTETGEVLEEPQNTTEELIAILFNILQEDLEVQL